MSRALTDMAPSSISTLTPMPRCSSCEASASVAARWLNYGNGNRTKVSPMSPLISNHSGDQWMKCSTSWPSTFFPISRRRRLGHDPCVAGKFISGVA